MTQYTLSHTQLLSPDVAARKTARKKVIEKAHKLERDSYQAMMQKRRQLQTSYQLDRMV
jgi:hypothetical protein